MGWILVSMMFLFILPTYNLVKSYVDFEKQNQQVVKLKKSIMNCQRVQKRKTISRTTKR